MLSALAIALAIGVFYVGIYPTHLLEAAQAAGTLLFT
jgi:hypothetical protein